MQPRGRGWHFACGGLRPGLAGAGLGWGEGGGVIQLGALYCSRCTSAPPEHTCEAAPTPAAPTHPTPAPTGRPPPPALSMAAAQRAALVAAARPGQAAPDPGPPPAGGRHPAAAGRDPPGGRHPAGGRPAQPGGEAVGAACCGRGRCCSGLREVGLGVGLWSRLLLMLAVDAVLGWVDVVLGLGSCYLGGAGKAAGTLCEVGLEVGAGEGEAWGARGRVGKPAAG